MGLRRGSRTGEVKKWEVGSCLQRDSQGKWSNGSEELVNCSLHSSFCCLLVPRPLKQSNPIITCL